MAMKALACRRALPGYKGDEEDLRFLISKLGIKKFEEILRAQMLMSRCLLVKRWSLRDTKKPRRKFIETICVLLNRRQALAKPTTTNVIDEEKKSEKNVSESNCVKFSM